jgi:hypothetical protein
MNVTLKQRHLFIRYSYVQTEVNTKVFFLKFTAILKDSWEATLKSISAYLLPEDTYYQNMLYAIYATRKRM